jgi:hypothetical protein
MASARHCCTLCKFPPTITGFLGLRVGGDIQSIANWYLEMRTFGANAFLRSLARHEVNGEGAVQHGGGGTGRCGYTWTR